MARAITTAFTNSIAPGLRKVFFSSIKGIPQEARQILNFLPEKPGGQAGRNYFDDLRVASLGTFGTKPEGTAISYDVPVEDVTVRYSTYTFGLGVRLTMEMKEDDLYGTMSKLSGELAASAMHQIEVQSHRPLNNAFSASGSAGQGFTQAGFNSEALIATSHTLVRGGTYANRASTDLDLSVTALTAAIDSLEGTPNESGMPMPIRPSLLLVPYQLKWIAKEILDSELKPYTGDNEVNPLGGEGIKYMCSHYIPVGNGTWFLMAPKAKHDINVWIRKQPTFDVSGEDFDTGDSKMKGVFRIAVGHGDWRGIYGSQGA